MWEKRWYHVKQCPENGNRNFDKRERIVRLSKNILWQRKDENDSRAITWKSGGKLIKVRRKELNGENFAPTVQQPMNQEKSDIPEHFQCHSCRKIH